VIVPGLGEFAADGVEDEPGDEADQESISLKRERSARVVSRN
jgi:hypothetical protein